MLLEKLEGETSDTTRLSSQSLPLERNQEEDLRSTGPLGQTFGWQAGTAVLPYAQLRLTAHSEEAHTLSMPGPTRLHQAPSFGR